MHVQRAIDDALAGKIHPVYLIAGTERTLIARAIEVIRAATVGPGPRGLAEDHYDAGSTPAARVVDAARMLPMMSKWRFVLVRQMHEWRVDDLEVLAPYFDKSTPSTVLVLLADRLDGRTKFATAAKKKGVVFEAEPPSEHELPAWLKGETARRKIEFERGAADALLYSIGADLSALSDALDRLALYAHGRAITTDDVDAMVATVREASQFDLPDAIADKDVPRALGLWNDLVRQKAPGLLTLAFVAGRVRLLARARDAMDRGEDVTRAFRLHPKVAQRLPAWTRKWSAAQVTRGLKLCAAADRKLKSGGGKDRDQRVLEELILALAGAPGLGENALRE